METQAIFPPDILNFIHVPNQTFLEDCVLFIILVYPWINLQNCTLALNHQCSLRDLRGSDRKNLLWYSLPDCRECGPPRHNSPSENSLQEAVSGLSTRTLYTSPALFLLHRHVKLCVSFLPYSQKLPSSGCDRENKLFFQNKIEMSGYHAFGYRSEDS